VPPILSMSCGSNGVRMPDSTPPAAAMSRLFAGVSSEAITWVNAHLTVYFDKSACLAVAPGLAEPSSRAPAKQSRLSGSLTHGLPEAFIVPAAALVNIVDAFDTCAGGLASLGTVRFHSSAPEMQQFHCIAARSALERPWI